jgi:hypothetical protein
MGYQGTKQAEQGARAVKRLSTLARLVLERFVLWRGHAILVAAINKPVPVSLSAVPSDQNAPHFVASGAQISIIPAQHDQKRTGFQLTEYRPCNHLGAARCILQQARPASGIGRRHAS